MANRALVCSCVGFDPAVNAVLVGMTKAEAKLLRPAIRPPRTIDSRANIFVIDNIANGATEWFDADLGRTAAAFEGGLASCLLLRLVLRCEHVSSFVS